MAKPADRFDREYRDLRTIRENWDRIKDRSGVDRSLSDEQLRVILAGVPYGDLERLVELADQRLYGELDEFCEALLRIEQPTRGKSKFGATGSERALRRAFVRDCFVQARLMLEALPEPKGELRGRAVETFAEALLRSVKVNGSSIVERQDPRCLLIAKAVGTALANAAKSVDAKAVRIVLAVLGPLGMEVDESLVRRIVRPVSADDLGTVAGE